MSIICQESEIDMEKCPISDISSWPQVHRGTVQMDQWKCYTKFEYVQKTKDSGPRALALGRAWPGGSTLTVAAVGQLAQEGLGFIVPRVGWKQT